MKKISKYSGEIFLAFLVLGTISYSYYTNFIEPNQIKQEVTELPFREKLRMHEQWEMERTIFNDGRESKEKNPYGNLEAPCYVLETRLGMYQRHKYRQHTKSLSIVQIVLVWVMQ